MKKQSLGRKVTWLLLVVLIAILIVPARLITPVVGTSSHDWNPKSFWFEPWGASGVHKGIDVFAPKGRAVVAAAPGIVLYTGNINRGGTVVLVLGAKWRLQYFAHLDSVTTHTGAWLSRGDQIGTVGNTGNAAGKPAHLHFSVVTLIPYPWLWTSQTQGWKRMFYLNPGELIR